MSSVPVGPLSKRKNGFFPIPKVKGAIPLKKLSIIKTIVEVQNLSSLQVKFVFLLAVCGQHDINKSNV